MAEAPQTPALPSDLPVVPLRGAVVLPMTVAPLGVSRPMSVEAVNRALAGERTVLLLLQKTDVDEPGPDDLYAVGTVAIVRQMAKAATGMRVLVEGIGRAHADRIETENGMLRAATTSMPEAGERTLEIEAHMRRLQELVDRALSLATGLSPDLKTLVSTLEDPLRVTYLLASLLDMKAEDKQKLLEEPSLSIKMDAVATALAREIDVLEIKGRIESRAEKEMSDAQRQYLLRQQMKAIQSELGEGDSEAVELRRRVTDAQLPEPVQAAALREVDRLERMTPASPEYQMLRTYLDWVLDVPWDKPTEDRLDPVEARRVLDEDHYDLDKVKERIVEYLAVRKLKGDMKGPILCFVGPPGVGKTSLGQSIARAMTRKFVRISLGGVRDEAEIRGHRRTYIGSMPGRIVQGLKNAGSSNPVLMLDEIDKVSVGIQGDPAAALLEVLDPAQNHSFRDHYLEITLDLSKVLFIATANQLGTIHPALLDRMEMIQLGGYTEDEKVHISKMYLIPRQREEHGLKPDQIDITEPALRKVIADYTREAGVRSLERQIGTLARKVAARVATDGSHTARIDAGDVEGYLGPPRFRSDRVPDLPARRRDRRGVDGDRRRRALHRGGAAPRRKRPGHVDRPARRRDAGVGARGALAHPPERLVARLLAGVPQQAGHPRARASRRHPEGRAVGRRDDGDGNGVGGARRAGALGRGDDGRDHPVRPRAAGGRDSREGARGASPRHPHLHPARPERAGPHGAAGRSAQGHDLRARAHSRRGAGRRAAPGLLSPRGRGLGLLLRLQPRLRPRLAANRDHQRPDRARAGAADRRAVVGAGMALPAHAAGDRQARAGPVRYRRGADRQPAPRRA
jgi:endopeptidase La